MIEEANTLRDSDNAKLLPQELVLVSQHQATIILNYVIMCVLPQFILCKHEEDVFYANHIFPLGHFASRKISQDCYLLSVSEGPLCLKNAACKTNIIN